MELSIIIVNFNRKEYLLKGLGSIFRSLKNPDFEVIVVDNNSSDGSVEAVREKFPAVQIIVNDQNQGFGAANNQAVKEARGEFLMLLNNDTCVLDGAIEKLVNFLRRHPEAGLIGAKLLKPDGSVQKQGRPLWPFWKSSKIRSVSFLPATAVVIKKNLFEKLGGFDEKFFFYNEDLDLCRRIIKTGLRIYFLPDAEVIHHGGQSTQDLGPEAIVEGYLGGLRYCYKHYPKLIFYLYRMVVSWELNLKKLLTSPIALFSRRAKSKRAAWCQILRRAKNDEKIYEI